MATTHTCDRCDKIIQPLYWVKYGGDSGGTRLDLCEDCTRSLKGWLQPVPKEVSNE